MASHLSQPIDTIGDMRALKRRFAGPRFGEQRFGFRHHAQTLKYDGSELTKICAREPLFELVKVGREIRSDDSKIFGLPVSHKPHARVPKAENAAPED